MKLNYYKHNSIIGNGGRVPMLLNDILICILVDVYKKELLDKDKKYELEVSRYAELLGIHVKVAYQNLKSAALELRQITLVEKLDTGEMVAFSIIQHVFWTEEETTLKVQFDEYAIPKLSGFREGNYTTLSGAIVQAKCKYSANLYEYLQKNKFKVKIYIDLEEFRDILQVENEYKLFGDINAYIIKPALKDINRLADFHVNVAFKKEGRKVIGLIFYIE